MPKSRKRKKENSKSRHKRLQEITMKLYMTKDDNRNIETFFADKQGMKQRAIEKGVDLEVFQGFGSDGRPWKVAQAHHRNGEVFWDTMFPFPYYPQEGEDDGW